MKTIVLVSLLSVGCIGWSINDSKVYHIYVDQGFSSLQHDDILLVANEWQEDLGGYLKFVGTDNPNDPDTIAFYPSTSQEMESDFPGAIGETTYEGVSSTVNLTSSLDEGRFLQTARHELGHAIGITKHIGPGSVMCKDVGCANLMITCGDAIAFCSQSWGCDPYKMPVCQ